MGGASLPRLYRNIDTTAIPNHGKCIGVVRKILSPGNCAPAFNMSCDLKENITLTKRLSKLCYTVVAKIPQRPLFFGEIIPLTQVKFFMVSHQDL